MQFRTRRLPFSAYLVAKGLLSLTGVEDVGSNKVEFVFDDPNRKAEEYEFAFDSGDVVNAVAFVAAERQLRRRLHGVRSGGRN